MHLARSSVRRPKDITEAPLDTRARFDFELLNQVIYVKIEGSGTRWRCQRRPRRSPGSREILPN